jgi:hypothetical protein
MTTAPMTTDDSTDDGSPDITLEDFERFLKEILPTYKDTPEGKLAYVRSVLSFGMEMAGPVEYVARSLIKERISLRQQLTAEAKRLDWLERNHTLHNSVAIVYVVDGYEVQFSTHDGNNLVAETHGETLREAIDKCMEEVP